MSKPSPIKIAILLGLLFLALVSAVVYRGSKAREVPDVGEPFAVGSFVSAPVADDNNAFTLYAKARTEMVDLKSAVKEDPKRQEAAKKIQAAILNTGWTEANEDVRTWLEANRQALSVWKRASERPDAVEVPLDQVSRQSSFDVQESIRSLVGLALVEAERVSAVQNPRDAWTWYRACLRASRHCSMRVPITQRLAGIALYESSLGPLLRWSGRPELTAADLRQALDDVDALDRLTPPCSECLMVEYVAMKHDADAFASSLGVGGGPRIEEFHERVRRLMNLLFANWLSQADVPRRQRAPLEFDSPPLYRLNTARTNSRVREPADIARWFELPRTRGPLLFAVLRGPVYIWTASFFVLNVPDVAGCHDAIDREAVYRAVTVLGLALQVYRHEHDRYPAALDDLVKSGLLKVLPVDPFGNGEPLRYRRESGPPERAVVWSVWYDGVDQAGREASESDKSSAGDKVFRIAAPATAKSGEPGVKGGN